MHNNVSTFYITATHYFFPQIIGNDVEVTYSTLNSLYVYISAVFHNRTLLKYTYGRIVTLNLILLRTKLTTKSTDALDMMVHSG